MLKLILLGAPGSGKGTQAERISKKFGIPQISTGAILRKAIADQTPLGIKVKAVMDSGSLVPDEDVIAIVKERIKEKDCENGFILDGFPRTVSQAEALENLGIGIDKVISIEVNDDEIIDRMSGRRVCKKCGASYHVVYNPSATENVCDTCGDPLVVRDDDKPEVVKDRLAVYHKQTAPLIEFYKAKGKLSSVRGREILAETSAAVDKALEA